MQLPAPGQASGAVLAGFEHVQGLLRAVHYLARHAGHSGHVDTETVRHPSRLELAQEQHVVPLFLDGDVVILDARELLLHVVELVVMGGEQGLGPLPGLMDILHQGAGDAHAVVSGGAAAYLVEQHQRARREVVHNHRSLQHFHHEGGFAAGDVVGGAHAGENLVEIPEPGGCGRYEGARLGHQHNQRSLAQQGRFTRHVGAGENHYLGAGGVHVDVVRHVFLARGHQGFDDRMAARLDVEDAAAIYHGAAVTPVEGLPGEALEHVHRRHYAAVGLDVADALLHLAHQGGVDFAFHAGDVIFGREDLLFVFLELLGDIAFGVYQRLLAHPLRGHLALEGVAHLDVVAENVVVAYLEAADTGPLCLPFLHLQEITLASGGDVAELVEPAVHTAGYHLALAYLHGGILRHGGADLAQQGAAVLHALEQLLQRRRRVFAAEGADGLHLSERPAELHHFTREYPAGRRAGDYPFKVADVFYKSAQIREFLLVLGEEFNYVVTLVQGAAVHYGHRQPLPQKTGSHGGGAAVDGLGQAHSLPAGVALEDFQVAEGEAVHPHEPALFDAGQAADVPEAGMFGLFKVDDQRSGGGDGQRERIHSEALEAAGTELLQQLVFCRFLHEGPFIQRGYVDVGEFLPCRLGVVAPHHQLLGVEGIGQGVDVLHRALCHLEGAGAHVEEGRAAVAGAVESHAAEEVVLFLLQHPLAEGYAGRKYFCDTAFDQFVLGQFGIFQLVADGHFVARAH